MQLKTFEEFVTEVHDSQQPVQEDKEIFGKVKGSDEAYRRGLQKGGEIADQSKNLPKDQVDALLKNVDTGEPGFKSGLVDGFRAGVSVNMGSSGI